MTLLAEFLAALAIGILKYLQQREDLRKSVRDDLEKEAMRYAIKAAEYRARAVGLPYVAAFRVRDSTLSISIQSPVADAGSGAEDQPMRSEGPSR